MATMVDVAMAAGVSVSTVSHVVNGTRNVGPDTRARVLDAIEKTSYKQDALARAMRRATTDSIGLIISDPGEPVFAEMVHGIEQESSDLGLTLLLAHSAEDPERELKAVRVLLSRRVDGVILARSSGSRPEVLTELSGAGTPTVLLDRLFDVDLDQAGVENRRPMEELVDHLVERGHRSLALVAGDLAVPTLRERHEGFLNGVSKHRLSRKKQRVLVGASTVEEARRDVAELLAGPGRPTALIAAGTVLAAGALQAVQAASLRLPEDLAFAAFDGFAYADLFQPSITTIRQPAYEVGVQAMKLLADRLQNPDAPVTTVRLDPVIEYRRSTERS